jgi:hypothetical protein
VPPAFGDPARFGAVADADADQALGGVADAEIRTGGRGGQSQAGENQWKAKGKTDARSVGHLRILVLTCGMLKSFSENSAPMSTKQSARLNRFKEAEPALGSVTGLSAGRLAKQRHCARQIFVKDPCS